MSQPPTPGEVDGRHRKPGMNAVARRAGVSQKTVSRVVNDERYVSAAAREKVVRAARELGFRPNSAARALITGRFRRIGVVSLGTSLYGPASMLVALERATRAAGFSVIVANTAEGQSRAVSEGVEWLVGQGVDGVVIAEPIDDGTELAVPTDVPVFALGGSHGLGAERILLDSDLHAVGAGEATGHLIDLGHHRVDLVAGPDHWYAARARAAGWREAHHRRGLEPPPPFQGDWSPESGYRAGLRLAADPEVTAVYCANDDMAIGLMRALTDSGRRVPGEVSVVGYDDIPAAAYLHPPLTTVRQDFEDQARRAIDALLRRLPDSDAPAEAAAETPAASRLVVRDSTAPPPRRRDRVPRGKGTAP